MNVEYNWTLGDVHAKKEFTDKYGNKRNNVVKSVELIFKGKIDELERKESVIVRFDLVDLSEFHELENINKDLLLSWALSKLHQKQKLDIENNIKSFFGEYESNIIKIELNE
jgi:hypothetical protein